MNQRCINTFNHEPASQAFVLKTKTCPLTRGNGPQWHTHAHTHKLTHTHTYTLNTNVFDYTVYKSVTCVHMYIIPACMTASILSNMNQNRAFSF